MSVKERRVKNPLNCIPAAAIVRERLSRVLSEAEKLKILLRTAEEIEQADAPEQSEVAQ
jgi:hypothetical protein